MKKGLWWDKKKILLNCSQWYTIENRIELTIRIYANYYYLKTRIPDTNGTPYTYISSISPVVHIISTSGI